MGSMSPSKEHRANELRRSDYLLEGNCLMQKRYAGGGRNEKKFVCADRCAIESCSVVTRTQVDMGSRRLKMRATKTIAG
jgi:hypothetical protein